jgi:hypothetical protein
MVIANPVTLPPCLGAFLLSVFSIALKFTNITRLGNSVLAKKTYDWRLILPFENCQIVRYHHPTKRQATSWAETGISNSVSPFGIRSNHEDNHLPVVYQKLESPRLDRGNRCLVPAGKTPLV